MKINEIATNNWKEHRAQYDAYDALEAIYNRGPFTEQSLLQAQQYIKITGRKFRGLGRSSAGYLLDEISNEVRRTQKKSGQMPTFTGRATTTADLAKQLALQTNGHYEYHTPTTWSNGWGTRTKDPADFIEYDSKDAYDDAFAWVTSKGKAVHYKEHGGDNQTVYQIGKYIVGPATITRGAFSANPKTTYRLSVRTASALKGPSRAIQDISDQQASALKDIADTRNENSVEAIKRMLAVIKGEGDLKDIIAKSQKIDLRDKAKLDNIIAGAANFKEPD